MTTGIGHKAHIDQAGLGAPFAGEVAVVTGAGRGIGREAALVLARLGATVVVAELSAGGTETEAAIRDAGGAAFYVQVDVSDPISMRHLKDQAIARHGHVDIVVNNAVVFYAKPLLDNSVEEWDRVMGVNLRGAFLAAKLFLPDMLRRRHGTFVTMESGEGMPYMASYFASKVGLRSLAASLSQELGADSGVSVFCFGAGMVDTSAIREAIPRLAPLYGMSEEQFVKLSAPGGSLMTAEECATGLTGCLLHASQFNGEETAAPAGLAALGLGSRRTSPDVANRQEAAGGAHDGARVARELIADLRRECDSLGMFQRQWYKRMLKQRTGLSLEEWEAATNRATEPNAEHAARLKLLAGYFQKLEAEARGYIKDPEQLGQALHALERRRAEADSTATWFSSAEAR